MEFAESHYLHRMIIQNNERGSNNARETLAKIIKNQHITEEDVMIRVILNHVGVM